MEIYRAQERKKKRRCVRSILKLQEQFRRAAGQSLARDFVVLFCIVRALLVFECVLFYLFLKTEHFQAITSFNVWIKPSQLFPSAKVTNWLEPSNNSFAKEKNTVLLYFPFIILSFPSLPFSTGIIWRWLLLFSCSRESPIGTHIRERGGKKVFLCSLHFFIGSGQKNAYVGNLFGAHT